MYMIYYRLELIWQIANTNSQNELITRPSSFKT